MYRLIAATMILFNTATAARAETGPSVIFEPSLTQAEIAHLYNMMDQTVAADVQDASFKAMCPKIKVATPPVNTLVKVYTDVWSEITFARGSGETRATQPAFSLFVRFSERELALKHQTPRYTADKGGVRVPYPSVEPREVYLQGKSGSDLVIILPGMRGCSMNAVLICPRTFVPRASLSTTQYTPTNTMVDYSATADGVLATHAAEEGFVRASLWGTEGLKLPEPRLEEQRSTSATAALTYPPLDSENQPIANELSVTSLPLSTAIEAKVELSLPEQKNYTFTHRSAWYVAPFDLARERKVFVQGAELVVEPGKCFMVAKRQTSTQGDPKTP